MGSFVIGYLVWQPWKRAAWLSFKKTRCVSSEQSDWQLPAAVPLSQCMSMAETIGSAHFCFNPGFLQGAMGTPHWPRGNLMGTALQLKALIQFFLLFVLTCITDWSFSMPIHAPSASTPIHLFCIFPYKSLLISSWHLIVKGTDTGGTENKKRKQV